MADVGTAMLRCYGPPATGGRTADGSPAEYGRDEVAGQAGAADVWHAPVTVRVLADDQITGDAALTCLRSRPEVRVLSDGDEATARVVVILVRRVTGRVLAWMREAAEESAGEVGFVVVGDGIREHHLLGAVAHGPLSVIARHDADTDRIVRAVTGITRGWLEMPDDAVGWLAARLHAMHRDVLRPRGLSAAGLGTREVDVIKLLAEGLGTAEIAQRMNYSERTVKSIIHDVLARCQLRNRAHAVAFALRSGEV